MKRDVWKRDGLGQSRRPGSALAPCRAFPEGGEGAGSPESAEERLEAYEDIVDKREFGSGNKAE